MVRTHAYRLSLLLASAVIFGLAFGIGIEPARSEEAVQRRFTLNEDMIRGLTTPPDARACDPYDVLRDLFKQVAPVARIFPTENYYYFGFFRGGKSYSASLRLALDTRDQGILHYVCYETSTNWLKPDPGPGVSRQLSSKDGVSVRRLGDLEYQIEFQGTTVNFLLNRVDQTPDAQKLGPEEEFAGRIFDESGLVFDLVYSTSQKAFYFLLDATSPTPDLFTEIRERVFLSKRTGFIFFQDLSPKRLILIAVHADEVRKNTAYDGPFDQLPENFYEGVGFWKYFYDAYPDMKGKLSPGGTVLGSTNVVSIFAYRQYASEEDLSFVDACIRKHAERTNVILCLTDQPRPQRLP
jgi:hypothetical protein